MVSDRVTRFGEAQQTANASFQNRVKYYKRMGDRANTTDRAGSRDSSGEERSLRGPERKCKRKG